MIGPRPHTTLVFGPDGAARTEWLCRRVGEQLRKDPFAPVLYLASRTPLARQVRERLRAQCGGAVVAGRVTTLERFIRERSRRLAGGLPQISAQHERVLLQEILQRLDRQDGPRGERLRVLRGVERRPGICAAVGRLFHDARHSLVDSPEALEQRLADVGRDLRHDLCLVFRTYRQRLQAHNLADPEDGLVSLARCADLAPVLDERTLVVDGFYDFTPAQALLVRRLVDCAQEAYLSLDAETLEPDDGFDDGPFAATRRAAELYRDLAGRSERVDGERAGERAASAARLFTLAGPRPADGLEVLSLHTRADEVKGIARRIRAFLRDHAEAGPADVAVVFPSLEAYAPLIRELFPRYGVPYRLALEEPLHAAGAIQTVLELFEVVEGDFRREDVERFLASPYVEWKELDAPEADRAARAAGILGGDPDLERGWFAPLNRLDGEEWPGAAQAAQALGRLFAALSALDAELHIEDFRARLLALLDQLGLPRKARQPIQPGVDEAIVARDAAALEAFETLLGDLVYALSLGDQRPRPLADHAALLRQAVRSCTFRMPAQFADGVRVLGRLDARALDVRLAIVGGLTEEEFPGGDTPDALIPEPAARPFPAFDRPAEDRLLFLSMVLAGRERTILTRPRQGDTAELGPSPFLAELERVTGTSEQADGPAPAEPLTPGEVQRHVACRLTMPESEDAAADAARWCAALRADPAASRTLDALLRGLRMERARETDPVDSPFAGAIRAKDLLKMLSDRLHPRKRPYSVSRLDTYARCPFHFAAQQLLGLEELEDVEPDLAAVDRGSLLHDILAAFYARRRGRGATAKPIKDDADREQARAQLLAIAREQLSKTERSGPFWDAWCNSLCAGLASNAADAEPHCAPDGLLATFLAAEQELYDESQFVPAELEVWFGPPRRGGDEPAGAPLEIDLGQGRRLALNGRIDRIDRRKNPNGTVAFRVYDYKTGRVPGLDDLYQGIAFQLPVYLLAAESLLGDSAVADGAYYYQVKDREQCGLGKNQALRLREGEKKCEMRFPPDAQALDAFLHETIPDALGRLVASMLSGWFATTLIDTGKAGCDYCEMRHACRHDARQTEMRREAAEARKDVYLPRSLPAWVEEQL